MWWIPSFILFLPHRDALMCNSGHVYTFHTYTPLLFQKGKGRLIQKYNKSIGSVPYQVNVTHWCEILFAYKLCDLGQVS